MSAEFAFKQRGDAAVYSVYCPVVCLDCGMSRGYLAPDTLAGLRSPFSNGLEGKKKLIQTKCLNCDSSRLAVFERVEITFGLGKGPPVQLAAKPTVNICLECGVSDFLVPSHELANLRATTGVVIRPPSSTMLSKRARGTA